MLTGSRTANAVFESTKQTDREKALQFCRTLEYASRESKAERLTEARARELISEIVLHTTGEPLRFYTAEDWLRDWLKGKEAAKSEGTFYKYKYTVESFLTSLGERAKRNLNQITPRDIQRFRDAELEAGKHPRTCNFAVKHLRMPFNVARRQGLITHNPAEAVEMLPTIANRPRQPFDLEQVKAILKAAQGDWRGAIMVALYTGARLQDVTDMRWESVDLENNWIAFRAGKTRPANQNSDARFAARFSSRIARARQRKGISVSALAGKRTGGKSGLSMAFSASWNERRCAAKSFTSAGAKQDAR